MPAVELVALLASVGARQSWVGLNWQSGARLACGMPCLSGGQQATFIYATASQGFRGAPRSFSQAGLHVHHTFFSETDRTASAILPTTAGGLWGTIPQNAVPLST